MKIIGIKDYQQQEINAAELMQLATGYHNSRYSMRVAGIWDSVNSRILIGLDDDANGSEKSHGPSGTHYVLRSLNYIYAREFDLEEEVNLADSDKLPGCVDFDINLRGDQLVATLPHKVARFIPGVVGLEQAAVKRSWLEVFGGYGKYVFQALDYCKSPNNCTKIRLENSIKKTAEAAGTYWFDLAEDLFRSLGECDPLEVAIVETLSPYKNLYGQDSYNWTVALSHVDAGFSGTETCKNGEIRIEWNRRPKLVLHVF